MSWPYPNTLVVGTVTDEAQALLAVACGANALEFRADLVAAEGLERMFEGVSTVAGDAGIPVIFTMRSNAEGGGFAGSPGDSAAGILKMAAHVQIVDIELVRPDLDGLAMELHELGISVIVSHHDFKAQPEIARLRSMILKALEAGDVVKLAVTPSSLQHVLEIYRLLHESDGYLCVIGMGEIGRQTRLVAPLFGSKLTYGYTGEAFAPGQMSVRELVEGLKILGVMGV